jgi:hypothetical protein
VSTSPERDILIESVRTYPVRKSMGPLSGLGGSIKAEGLRQPLTLWTDGTLISGARRLRAHFLMAGALDGSQYRRIKAVFVDTIEDAAKRLTADMQDDVDDSARPMKWSEVCRLWELLRRLDEPAAIKRAQAARRRGVELRRKTYTGERPPGRSPHHSDDYALSVLCEPFDISGSTARRLWSVYSMATGLRRVSEERQAAAVAALAAIDSKESTISANYQRLMRGSITPVPAPPAAVVASAAAAKQLTAWERSLPQLEGLTTGLSALGAPNSELAWEQVGPAHARLMKVRRDLDKIIRQMKETNKS